MWLVSTLRYYTHRCIAYPHGRFISQGFISHVTVEEILRSEITRSKGNWLVPNCTDYTPLAKSERTLFPVGLKQKYTGAPAPSQNLRVWGPGTCAAAQKGDLSWKPPWVPTDLQPLPAGICRVRQA